MRVHTFDIDIAAQIGVNQAIMLNNIYFWVKKNEANNNNFFEGKHWTYNSVGAFSELFPYWSNKQIRLILTKLINDGYIESGNFNKAKYDKTRWFTLTNKAKSLGPSGQKPLPIGAIPFAHMGQPIPDNKPDNKHIYNIYSHWNTKGIINHRKKNPKMEYAIKKAIKDYGEEEIINAINNYAIVVKSEKYWFSYSWTLTDFLKRGLDRFIDESKPLRNFLKERDVKGGPAAPKFRIEYYEADGEKRARKIPVEAI